jgi:hypothetical protein
MSDTFSYNDRLVAMMPSGTSDLVKTASRRQCRKPSEYIREAVIHKLESDGYCLVPAGDNNKKVA